jgi:ankyrin repeat protein
MARTIFTTITIAIIIPLAAHASNAEFLQAARTNDTALIQALLARGLDPDTRDENSATALMFAAAYGYAEMARILIDSGADVQAQSESGGTALAFATGWGHRDIVEILQQTPALQQPGFAGLIPTASAVLISLLAVVAIPALAARLNHENNLQPVK